MDLEHLTKGQIILLTLLVSFMTSIATGIVTVSLMQQMPAPVTQTINRVVERTLERVVEKKTDAQGITTTKEKTVVIKETDLISNAVQAALPSLVAVYITQPAPSPKPVIETELPRPEDAVSQTATASIATGTNAATEPTPQPEPTSKKVRTFVARGVYVADGTVLTDAATLPEIAEGTAVELSVIFLASGAEVPVTNVKISGTNALLTVAKKSGAVIATGDTQSLQLGNTLVVLGGEGRVQVATGIVSNLDRDDKKQVTGITVDGVSPQAGAVLVNLEGRLLAQFNGGSWVLQ